MPSAFYNMREIERMCDNGVRMKGGKMTERGTGEQSIKKQGRKN